MSDLKPIGEVRTLVLAVPDMDQACTFYSETLGLTLKFRDGTRWATFDAGPLTIALAGEDQRPGGSGVAVNIKVADLAAALARAVAGGAVVVEEPFVGAHETRASIRDPAGLLYYIYTPLTRPPVED